MKKQLRKYPKALSPFTPRGRLTEKYNQQLFELQIENLDLHKALFDTENKLKNLIVANEELEKKLSNQ